MRNVCVIGIVLLTKLLNLFSSTVDTSSVFSFKMSPKAEKYTLSLVAIFSKAVIFRHLKLTHWGGYSMQFSYCY